jgi:hypothetical protein
VTGFPEDRRRIRVKYDANTTRRKCTRLAVALSSGIWALVISAPALATPGQGGMGGSSNAGGGCGGCGGGGDESSISRQEASQQAGDAARNAMNTGGSRITVGGGGRRDESVSGASLDSLGASMADAEARARRDRDNLDIFTALTAATNRASGRNSLDVWDANDRNILAGQAQDALAGAAQQAQGFIDSAAGVVQGVLPDWSGFLSGSAPPAAAPPPPVPPSPVVPTDPAQEYIQNLILLESITDSMAGRPVDMDEPIDIGIPIRGPSRNEMLGWQPGTPAPDSSPPQAINAPPSSGNPPALGGSVNPTPSAVSSGSASAPPAAVSPTSPGASMSATPTAVSGASPAAPPSPDWVDLPPDPDPVEPETDAAEAAAPPAPPPAPAEEDDLDGFRSFDRRQ